jgi:hypothetical protein
MMAFNVVHATVVCVRLSDCLAVCCTGAKTGGRARPRAADVQNLHDGDEGYGVHSVWPHVQLQHLLDARRVLSNVPHRDLVTAKSVRVVTRGNDAVSIKLL